MASLHFHLPAFKFQLAKGSVARAHEMMTNAYGVAAAAGRSAELSPEVDWSGRRRVGTIVGGIRTDMDGAAYC